MLVHLVNIHGKHQPLLMLHSRVWCFVIKNPTISLKASVIVASATSIGLSLCTCRHKASHLGRSCQAPLETCLTMGKSTDILIKKNMAVSITNNKALKIIVDCKKQGLMQIADNVQRDVGFICNCCSCCCEFIQAIKRFDLRHAVTVFCVFAKTLPRQRANSLTLSTSAPSSR
ncbi:MAG: 4Fe-4S ferredoxin iron-sulfur binding protein [Firmicutes bacterium]|nr:4Fe-4S ferredoxin iron-sulfur binding protein [Bacillota bacterium]